MPSSYQVVLWKQESFVVLRPLQIEFFRNLLGHIQMHAAGNIFDLPTGRVLVLDRAVSHDVEALVGGALFAHGCAT
jgi:mannose-6-phosphate isomerase-like protein (cupin superfamily)